MAIPALDFALRADPQPEKTFRFPAPCPEHEHGDECRLDFRAKGWPRGTLCAGEHRGKCVPVWRSSILCNALFTAHYCEKALPDDLRRLTVQPGIATPAGVSATATSN